MSRYIVQARIERWLIPATILLVLLAGTVWAHERWGRPTGTAVTVAIAPGRALYLNIWKQGPDYDPGDHDRHDRLIPGGGPMQVAIWYQDTTTVLTRRLAIFELPAWPLIVMSVSAVVVLLGKGWIGARQRARASLP
jgi:hypothetical protein